MELSGIRKKPVKGNQYMKNLLYKKGVKIEEENTLRDSITFYDLPPDTTLSIDEFEKYALARLKVLRLIERINMQDIKKYTKDWANLIVAEIRKENLMDFYLLLADEKDEIIRLSCRKFDNISHYLLRLAYARTEEQRKWFIALEVDFFRVKLLQAAALQITSFLKSHNFPGEKIGPEEKAKQCQNIMAASFILQQKDGFAHDVYKVPFIYALDLVRQRRVFLKNGFAYVAYPDLIGVICTAFRCYLSECLSMVKKNMHLVEQDQRIIQVITDFDKRHTGNDFVPKGNSDTIYAANLPSLSAKSFPLCMKSLYDVVVKEHHLKHFGRLQLGLFLKGIGVPVEEATKFWRGHFTQRPEIDGSRFDKQYLYNIRHMYGQEGKRADYTPYSCMKVITSSVGTGDHHGCPFKHSDQANLRLKLTAAEIPSQGVKEILDLAEKHHYQIACQKYFEWTHDKMSVEGGVNHPNHYFLESRAVLGGKKTIKAEANVKTTRINVYADGTSSKRIKQEVKTETEPVDEVEADPMEIDDNEEVDKIMSEIDF